MDRVIRPYKLGAALDEALGERSQGLWPTAMDSGAVAGRFLEYVRRNASDAEDIHFALAFMLHLYPDELLYLLRRMPDPVCNLGPSDARELLVACWQRTFSDWRVPDFDADAFELDWNHELE